MSWVNDTLDTLEASEDASDYFSALEDAEHQDQS